MADMKWIPVTERLPELHGDYLVVVKYDYDDQFVDIAINYKTGWKNLLGEKSNVTHWMPLPEPPKEVE